MFRDNYAARAGIEGTHAQAISRCGLRWCRYIGLAKTRLQHILATAAVNLVRVAEWYAGTPVAKTRFSRFATLQAVAYIPSLASALLPPQSMPARSAVRTEFRQRLPAAHQDRGPAGF